jgi:hypothetical protein
MPDPPSRRYAPAAPRSDSLADILERVLETGIVIAGDIKVNLNNVELLTIQIRLVICSVDKAREMGMDWWQTAPYLTSNPNTRLPAPPPAADASRSDAPPAAEAAARAETRADVDALREALDAARADVTAKAEEVDDLNARMARLEWQLAQLLTQDDADAPPPAASDGDADAADDAADDGEPDDAA